MTDYELHGPWTGAALNPKTRRTWLKHRWRFRLAIIGVLALIGGFLAMTWLNEQPQPRQIAKVCGYEGGTCPW
jgi:hypothetical protein